jgi:hypothetical protein
LIATIVMVLLTLAGFAGYTLMLKAGLSSVQTSWIAPATDNPETLTLTAATQIAERS